jgi:hypothetical protein
VVSDQFTVFFVISQQCGGPIYWKSGRQSIVTLSSTEAEFVSLTVAAKEAAAISRLLKEIMLY